VLAPVLCLHAAVCAVVSRLRGGLVAQEQRMRAYDALHVRNRLAQTIASLGASRKTKSTAKIVTVKCSCLLPTGMLVFSLCMGRRRSLLLKSDSLLLSLLLVLMNC
jgi:hypothetical protein